MEKFPKRKNIRLHDVDYSAPGAYFITICTKKEKLLWNGELDIQNFDWKLVGACFARPQNLPLSEIGIAVEQNLNKWNETYVNTYLSSYVIMPNHLHIIVVILPHEEDGRAKRAPTVGTMINQFKVTVTKQLGENIWQKSFYDHIIRNKHDYEEISKYIYENPLKLQFDEFYCE